jgi:hypothetical protein
MAANVDGEAPHRQPEASLEMVDETALLPVCVL